ncbi:hypothetical protein L484_005344 [Morus notabilis]|uniref:Uncharacterized protein n=1 Tax=Morus notabilis TaxID=981085 RepID=W9QV62_9ROSA|nr:hypothetical protein L484_005344 [Morus notabilis]
MPVLHHRRHDEAKRGQRLPHEEHYKIFVAWTDLDCSKIMTKIFVIWSETSSAVTALGSGVECHREVEKSSRLEFSTDRADLHCRHNLKPLQWLDSSRASHKFVDIPRSITNNYFLR